MVRKMEFMDECPEPDCGNICEIFQRYYHDGAGGRVYFFRTRCLNNHVRDLPVSRAEWASRA